MNNTYPRTLFCVVPVHNRINATRRFLDQICRQKNIEFRLIIVDDGSKDGTSAMLRSYTELPIQIVKGSGKLWWGGGMRLGMKVAHAQMHEQDALLMLNDDIEIDDDFLARLAYQARTLGPYAVIGCQQRDLTTGQQPFFGYTIDFLRCRLDMLRCVPTLTSVVSVDALCGRGTLFSNAVVRRIGYINSRKFPHFWGDIEITARAKDAGFLVVCDPSTIVSTSFQASDQQRLGGNRLRVLLSPVSSRNILQHFLFWLSCGPGYLRWTAILRFPAIKMWRTLKLSISG